ncbi:MAG: acyl-CoA dehydratase activase [Chloroflexi bacterium]|nr:acyl-CoA dehydratase activase [Chloroflexota bacterium]
MYALGLDIGSAYGKAVLLQGEQIVASRVLRTDGNMEHTALGLLDQILAAAHIPFGEITFAASTGIGRHLVPFTQKTNTEITCQARGIAWMCPTVRSIIDIGGQDCKGIKLDEAGRTIDFVMNDKCAAGTGRFLEVMATVLGISLENLGATSIQATQSVKIASTCTVFGESEVVSHLAHGAPKEQIVRGLHEAIARRIAGMVGKTPCEPDLVITGGVAKNVGAVRALEQVMGMQAFVPPEPQITAALGCALMAERTQSHPRPDWSHSATLDVRTRELS